MREKPHWKVPDNSVCEAGHYILFTQSEVRSPLKPPVLTYTVTMPELRAKKKNEDEEDDEDKNEEDSSDGKESKKGRKKRHETDMQNPEFESSKEKEKKHRVCAHELLL